MDVSDSPGRIGLEVFRNLSRSQVSGAGKPAWVFRRCFSVNRLRTKHRLLAVAALLTADVVARSD